MQFDWLETQETIGAKVMLQSFGSQTVTSEIQETLNAIKDESENRNLPLYIHARSEKDQTTALDMEPRALMHAYNNSKGELQSDEFIENMAESGTYQVPTFSLVDQGLFMFNPERLEDPLLELVAPESELAFARDPNVAMNILGSLFPWMPKLLQFLIVPLAFNENIKEVSLQSNLQSVQRLHDANVKIVMGSDTVLGTPAAFQFHGYTSLREIELLGEAGLTPMESIQAATINAAEMLGLDNEIGTVEVGKRADLVIVKDDPLIDLANLKTILYTVQGGVAKTPEQWMQQ